MRIGDTDHLVSVSTDGITVDESDVEIALEYTPGDRLVEAELDGAPLTVKIARRRGGFTLTTRGASHAARVLPAHVAPYAQHLIEKIPPDLSRFLLCPMPGLLQKVYVGAGDKVEAGQPLAVVEAMKMENILRARKIRHRQIGRGRPRRQSRGRCRHSRNGMKSSQRLLPNTKKPATSSR